MHPAAVIENGQWRRSFRPERVEVNSMAVARESLCPRKGGEDRRGAPTVLVPSHRNLARFDAAVLAGQVVAADVLDQRLRAE